MNKLRFTVALWCFFVLSSAFADTQADLEQVRKKITALEKQIASSYVARDGLQKRLAETERQTQEIQKNIQQLVIDLKQTEQRLAKVQKDKEHQLNQLGAQKFDLAAQIYAAYIAGRQEKIKLLLSQKEPADIGRVAVYYRYLQQYRFAQIELVKQILFELDELSSQINSENRTIKKLQVRQRAELELLKAARAERSGALSAIQKRINTGDKQVAELRAQENRLLELIKELEEIMREFPVGSRSSFAKLKGQLPWPIRGQLLADFGQARAGSSIRWDGVLIGADRGTAVRVVARGRVAYADWLPGQGLLVVIEHGDDFFTLYGRNDTISAKPGDWVEAGEVIASVGDSGGQAQTALYFAVRQKGKAVNPRKWTKAR